MPALASETSEWVRMANAEELNKTISGNTFIFKKGVTTFYREDGNMIELDKKYGGPIVRKWEVNEFSQLCYYIYSLPDKLLGCAVFDRAPGDAEKFKATWRNSGGNISFSGGASFFGERIKEAPKNSWTHWTKKPEP